MATKNKKAVMAYLTPELERFVGDYCERQGLTFTKDGETSPRLGTGIVELLESLRLGGNTSQSEVQDPDNGLSERLSIVEGSLGKLTQQIENMAGHGLAIANLQGKLIGLEGDLAALKRPPEPIETKGEAISPEQQSEPLQAEIEAPVIAEIAEPMTVVEGGEIPSLDDPNGWGSEQLAARLGVSKAWIQGYRNKPGFDNRTSEKDPDGLAWESRPPEGKKRAALFPIIGDRQLTPDPKTLTE